jgi:hypothetical protein
MYALQIPPGGAMRVEIRKTEYPRKRPQFSVWLANEQSEAHGIPGFFCALPQNDEPLARVVGAAMELLIKTEKGRALVQEADGEMLGCV